MNKKVVCCLLVALLLVCNFTVAFADTISDKKKELKGIDENIESAKSDIEEVKEEQDILVKQIADIEIDLKDKQKQLTEVEEILEEIQKNVEITQVELDEAIEKENAHRKLMDERVCVMYMCSDTSYLEILLDAENFTDFLDKIEMIKEIISLDQEVLTEMEAIKEEVEDRKQALEAQQEAEEGLKSEIIAQKEAIEAQQAEKAILLAEVKEKQEKMEKDLDKLEKTSKDLETEIKRLVAEREERERMAPNSRGGDRPSKDSGSTLSGNIANVISVATNKLGFPYIYGAGGPSSFDCSGFTRYVYGQCGVSLDHNAARQANCTTGVKISSRNALKPGDLVFFSNSSSSLGHAGIYMGGGQFIHASSSEGEVVIESIDSDYRRRHFRWGRRIFN